MKRRLHGVYEQKIQHNLHRTSFIVSVGMGFRQVFLRVSTEWQDLSQSFSFGNLWRCGLGSRMRRALYDERFRCCVLGTIWVFLGLSAVVWAGCNLAGALLWSDGIGSYVTFLISWGLMIYVLHDWRGVSGSQRANILSWIIYFEAKNTGLGIYILKRLSNIGLF